MKVRVTRDVSVPVKPTVTLHYEDGFEGTAPRAVIARIVAAGAGERLGPALDEPAGDEPAESEPDA